MSKIDIRQTTFPFMGPRPKFTFADLFAGIGGFHLALHGLGGQCVLAAERDTHARQSYEANFGRSCPDMFASGRFVDDVTKLDAAFLKRTPNFDILCGGHPCQAFASIGKRLGFEDERGNLFYDLLRVLRIKRPGAYFFENVRGLEKHDEGRTFATIRALLADARYSVHAKIVRATDFGLPQHRPRLYYVGFDRDRYGDHADAFAFPTPTVRTMTMSDVWGGECTRDVGFTLRVGGRLGRLDDRHNWDGYVVDGVERRLGPVEGRKMMGLPPNHVLSRGVTHAMKQLGNSVAVPAVAAVCKTILAHMCSDGRRKRHAAA